MKKNISKELGKGIIKNNTMVDDTVKEYQVFDYLDLKVNALKRSKIRPYSEMKGKGLRSTYVSLGSNWLEEKFIIRWKKETEEIKKNQRLIKIKQITSFITVNVFLVSMIIFYSYTLYIDGIKPAFGEEMKRLKQGELVFDDISRFSDEIFAEINKPPENNVFSFLKKGLPPEIAGMWTEYLKKIQNASSLFVKNVLIDPNRKDIFYINCVAYLTNEEIEFRIQCKKQKYQFAFLALE